MIIKDIYNTISDPMYYNELLKGYENEEMNQWLLYTSEGANNYYNQKDSLYNQKDVFGKKDIESFAKKCGLDKSEKTLLISLGCGNSEMEKVILDGNKNIDYVGVDTSIEMLKMSLSNLTDTNNKKFFIRADFSSNAFLKEIEEIGKNYDTKIYAFFGGTFGNIKHTKIINILNNLLNKGEKIRLDIYTRLGESISDDINLYSRYKEGLLAKKVFLMNRLLSDGIKENDGELTLESKKIEGLNALLFTYYFYFKRVAQIEIKSEKITFLPGSKLTLHKIYRFEPNSLVEFFENFDFNILKSHLKGHRGQFLFEKK